MKKFRELAAIGFAIVLQACNFSIGTKTDLATGLSYTYNGFTVDEVVLVGADNSVLSTNKVDMNTKVGINVQGLGNYELKDGKAFPGLMLNVTDEAGAEIINEQDLFANNEGYDPVQAANLQGTLTVGTPMQSGRTYHMKMKVWDKIKTSNVLTADVDIVVN